MSMTTDEIWGDGEAFEANRARWDELARVHPGTKSYDVEGFKAGRCTLMSVEKDELGDVAGRSMLHLQCHFGLDSLSWARKGAKVTGVDFSSEAIAAARALASEMKLDARFVESDVYRVPEVLDNTFDIVFTSYGTICWLPDIDGWARVAANALEPGGTFYIADSHPFPDVFDEREQPLEITFDYFHRGAPIFWEEEGSYADHDAKLEHTSCYVWMHPIGRIVTALIEAGLVVEFLHEFPESCFQRFPGMTKGDDDWWHMPVGEDRLPLTFSIRARRPIA